jgi:hypothetical protein
MARGITEAQVHAAADALVAAGERPTVERIRAHLGSGSPNTVTRLLETWWAALGQRLAARSRIAVEAPDVVQRLVGDLWEEAIAAGRELAEAALAPEREELQQARNALAAQQAQDAAAIAAASQAREAADQARALAEARLAEALRRADQLEGQLADGTAHRAALSASIERLEQDRAELTTRLQAEHVTTAQEREAQAAHVRAVEDRAHAEVDRARQETQDLRGQLRAIASERGRERESLETALKKARTELSVAQRDLAKQTGRADTLERQLLASQVRTARGASKPVPRDAPSEAPAPKPRRARASR